MEGDKQKTTSLLLSGCCSLSHFCWPLFYSPSQSSQCRFLHLLSEFSKVLKTFGTKQIQTWMMKVFQDGTPKTTSKQMETKPLSSNPRQALPINRSSSMPLRKKLKFNKKFLTEIHPFKEDSQNCLQYSKLQSIQIHQGSEFPKLRRKKLSNT